MAAVATGDRPDSASSGLAAPLPHRAAEAGRRLPDGAADWFRHHLAQGLAISGEGERSDWLDDDAVARRLLAPLVLDPDWPEPSAPLAVGSGLVHGDLTDDDHEAFSRLRAALAVDDAAGLPCQLSPETLAAQAQAWRLPVTPYRRPDQRWAAALDQPSTSQAAAPPAPGALSSPPSARPRPRGDTPLVIDLTALWAGPLATALLAELGADVIKVDGAVRPDGLRQHPAVYHELNGAKSIIDLDLRRPDDRAHFETLLGRADLLVDSFSRRVLPNLGYDWPTLSARFPWLASLSIVAFGPKCPEADWVSYGPGVHAISGLGHQPDGGHRPAPLAYPDALAGSAAFAAATGLLSGARAKRRVEVSLAGAVAPLVLGRRP